MGEMGCQAIIFMLPKKSYIVLNMASMISMGYIHIRSGKKEATTRLP